jgi:flagella basal body P-ring formation protein FlgA
MNKFFKISLLITFIFAAPVITWGATSEPTVTIQIPETVEVTGPKLCLNDLGTIKEGQTSASDYLKKVGLGTAPAPGQVRTFNREYLDSIIRQYNFPVTIDIQMGELVSVMSIAACIKKADIEAAVQKLFNEKKPHLMKRWVELHNIPDVIWLNQGEWKIEASMSKARTNNSLEVGNALFRVVLSRGNESRVLNISGKIRATALVYRAVKNIAYKSLVNTSDFELIEMELQNGKEVLGVIPSQIRAIKEIKQGEVLRSDWFQPLPLVSKDQEDKVIVQDENVAIKILGVAKADGWLGDEILINNPVSHKIFKARVIDNGTVQLNIR